MIVRNYREEVRTDADGRHRTVRVYRSIGSIRTQLEQEADRWPRVLGDTLFVLESDRVVPLPTPDALRAWLTSRGKIHFTGQQLSDDDGFQSPVSITDLFHDLKQRPFDRYEGIERFPHEPPMPGIYYGHGEILPPTRGAFDELVSRFNAETEQDRMLLKALILTLFSGVNPGARPAFVITSPRGRRGAGKTATAEAIVSLVGGSIDLTPKEDLGRVLESFFANENLAKRAVLMDNLKGDLSQPVIERLITARTIQGHRLHTGRTSRVNTMTWIFTSNDVQVSNDLADRSVVIHIGNKIRGFDFESWAIDFIRENRDEIIAECIAALRAEPQGTVSSGVKSRFGEWERRVLCRLPNPNALASVIAHRRREIDLDTVQAEAIGMVLKQEIQALGFDPDMDRVYIPVARLPHFYEKATGMRNVTVKQASAAVRSMMGTGPLTCLTDTQSRTHGRCLLWVGPVAVEHGITGRVGVLTRFPTPRKM